MKVIKFLLVLAFFVGYSSAGKISIKNWNIDEVPEATQTSIVINTINATLETARKLIEKFDPLTISDKSFNILDVVQVSLEEAWVSGFSNFVLEKLEAHILNPSASAIFTFHDFSVGIKNLKVNSELIDAELIEAHLNVRGLTFEAEFHYLLVPPTITSFRVLPRVEGLSLHSDLTVNGEKLNITFEEDELVELINAVLEELKGTISEALEHILNKIIGGWNKLDL